MIMPAAVQSAKSSDNGDSTVAQPAGTVNPVLLDVGLGHQEPKSIHAAAPSVNLMCLLI